MVARVASFALDGVGTRRVTVEADIRVGLPAFTVVGLADMAVREARERVRGAIVNSGFEFPQKRITVNLAPAYLRKTGPHFDLAIALGVLSAAGQLDPAALDGCAVAGELAMGGELRAIRGALALGEGARDAGLSRLLLPASRAREAALVDGLEVLGVESLRHAIEVLRGSAEPVLPPAAPRPVADPDAPDLADVRGQADVVGTLRVAAAGGHNLFLSGSPGTGKTMLARRLPTIMPPMTAEEALAVTRIHSVSGLHQGGGLVAQRPFRSPHHLISASGLVGGGTTPMPGEITLAHAGVLFLDELPEFNRRALEALRQPLEDGRVVVVRGQRVLTFPTGCTLVAAANPCPCGVSGRGCRCGDAERERYRRRLSGPLLDRIDLHAAVARPSAEALGGSRGRGSSDVRAEVVAARERALARLAGTGATCNAQMTAAMLRELAAVSPGAERAIAGLYDTKGLTARGHQRVLRVARTIADLGESPTVEAGHVHAAVSLRLRADELDHAVEPRAVAA